jgi:biofilm PGA synthesis N-glycosyltransferase PgaC
MRWIFWCSAVLVLYAYLGYPLWLWLRSTWRAREVERSALTPSVSVVMVVRDEEAALPGKLRNLTALDYPRDRLEILVVSDGSTDGTDAILEEWGARGAIHPILLREHSGKARGLNQAMPVAQGEVVVFTDVRQSIEPRAIRLLVENFADASVGCVSGELMLGDPEGGESSRGMGLYWRVEKKVRELESLSGSTIGATGALYAARKALLVEFPTDLILDDVFLPMSVIRQGFRVVFDPRARAWDQADLGSGREFWRKVRTLSGNYQLVEAAPWLLSRENPSRWDFVSHKLLRLVVPFALAGLLLSSGWLSGPFFLTCLVAQIGFYTLSLLAAIPARLGVVGRVADAALTFVLLNTAALVAFRNFALGRKTAWGR